MGTFGSAVTHITLGTLKLEIYPDRKRAGLAAAQAAAKEIRRLAQSSGDVGVIFATGASQFDTLEALVSIQGVPWNRVIGFHLDEYIGLKEDHPASFRRYLRERLTRRVSMHSFFEINGNAPDIPVEISDYVKALRQVRPQLCLLGIGENGHLAFNDPAEADFEDPEAMKVVELDQACREQQAAEGWFANWKEVPSQALTLTIPTLFHVPKLIVSVPGSRKAQAIRRTLQDPITTDCPSTLLRTHPDATVYLDVEAAAELESVS